ncbi:MAG: prephenate dehydrogenase/arogenate dehydrogenase family protein [Armatimonadota bacterium]|nr:prephenate dehydrogenase/arogenate dehydrogenase family protein [Armatimonadota bacterium]MDR7451035.1 prephenate dehydrogenase/arogenate dehydrogenase family protein [Armatimonadota bacterium]MDR7465944.1 prephenate dehydrogenase/arogenate dehydrogenase family protein [Armatimonadota bacterium]MDR7494009.1 prephenate dehydrogenase/arogenate dehydrogenase family protein [Armatimonadota bacterium]MDR7498459.1 prephenate dehydrogenase/arogenate dehydrogenase family protein [Armatimonadota bact
MIGPRTVGIVGLGLIGTSLGLAIRQRRVAERVVGVDVDASAVEAARARGALDKGATTDDLLHEADLVVVAVPPDAVVEVAVRAAEVLRAGAVITDVASIKAPIVSDLERRLPRRVRYVGGHPMAGSERSGPQAADAQLLLGRPFIITPTAAGDREAVEMVSTLARGMGMRPVVLDAREHDDLVAQVSHLPYLLAVAVLNAASEAALPLQGPGFGGISRLAASPVEMWTQICAGNAAAIRRALGRVRTELDELERALGDREALAAVLRRARRRAGLEG